MTSRALRFGVKSCHRSKPSRSDPSPRLTRSWMCLVRLSVYVLIVRYCFDLEPIKARYGSNNSAGQNSTNSICFMVQSGNQGIIECNLLLRVRNPSSDACFRPEVQSELPVCIAEGTVLCMHEQTLASPRMRVHSSLHAFRRTVRRYHRTVHGGRAMSLSMAAFAHKPPTWRPETRFLHGTPRGSGSR